MPDPLIGWEQQRLAQYGVVLLLFGLFVVLSDQLQNQSIFNSYAAIVISTFVCIYMWRALEKNPGYIESLQLVSLILMVLLPSVVCLQLFRELLQIN